MENFTSENTGNATDIEKYPTDSLPESGYSLLTEIDSSLSTAFLSAYESGAEAMHQLLEFLSDRYNPQVAMRLICMLSLVLYANYSTGEIFAQDDSDPKTPPVRRPNFEGCSEVVLDGPTLVWPGSTVKFTGDVTWPGKPDAYELWDGYGKKIYSMQPYEVVSLTFTSTVHITDSPKEFAGSYYIKIQGPLINPYCEETHLYGIVSPFGVFIPIISVWNND